jgi:hypothetical protein
VVLVPRQLQRSGMTGNVPYYGGRFTPAQAYAASHPRQQRNEAALRHLLDTGVITADEYADLSARTRL